MNASGDVSLPILLSHSISSLMFHVYRCCGLVMICCETLVHLILRLALPWGLILQYVSTLITDSSEMFAIERISPMYLSTGGSSSCLAFIYLFIYLCYSFFLNDFENRAWNFKTLHTMSTTTQTISTTPQILCKMKQSCQTYFYIYKSHTMLAYETHSSGGLALFEPVKHYGS